MTETITIKDVYNEIKRLESNMVTKKELNRLLETIEILSNKETMKQIKSSEADIKSGRLKEVSSPKDLF